MIFRKIALVLVLAPTCAVSAPTAINAVARYANTTGTSLIDSLVKINNSGSMSGLYNLAIGNDISSVTNIHMTGGNLTGVNNIQMSGDLTGANDLVFSGDLVADGDLYMQGNLYGVTNIHMNGGNITGAVDIDMEGNLNMSNVGNIEMSGGEISGAKSIIMTGDGDLTGIVNIVMNSGDISGANNIVMAGTGDLTDANNIQLYNDLDVGNNTHIVGNLVVDGFITGSLSDGNVVFGSGTSTFNAFARYANTTGKLIKNSLIEADDAGNINGINDLTMTGDINDTNNINMSGAGDISNARNLYVTGDFASGDGNIEMTGNLIGVQNITVAQDITISGTTFINRLASSAPGSEGVVWPINAGSVGQFLGIVSDGALGYDTPTGAGNVSADNAFTTDNKVVLTAFTDGARSIKESTNVRIDASDNISGVATLGATTVNAQTINATTGAATINTKTINVNTGAGTVNALTVNATTVVAPNLTGLASLNLPLAGGTLTGNLTLLAGNAGAPSINFTGGTTTGLSAETPDRLSFDTAGAEHMSIDGAGTISINDFTTAGIVHNALTTGALSSSLIIDGDVDPAAGIVDTKLATISTTGKVLDSATTATSLNYANTIVRRDSSNNFSAGTITANLIGGVTGLASLNLPLAGGTLSNNLDLATQSAVNFQDAAGGQYVGLRAPATVGTSYTIDLPGTAPVTGQFLQATAPDATTWAPIGGAPALGKTFYVAKNGSDSTGDGSLSAPFLTVNQAVAAASSLIPAPNYYNNPITINVGAGLFMENRIDITVSGLSIVGSSFASTIISPNNPTSENLFQITTPYLDIANLTIQGPYPFNSTYSGINIVTTAYGRISFNTVAVALFQTGINISTSGTPPTFFFQNLQCAGNTTSIALSNAQITLNNSVFRGPLGGGSPTNTGITITGGASSAAISNSLFQLTANGIAIAGGSQAHVLSSNFDNTTNSISCVGDSKTQIIGCNFIYNNANSVNVLSNGSEIYLEGCLFDLEDAIDDLAAGTAIKIINNGSGIANACTIENAVIGIDCGPDATDPGDLSHITANSFTFLETVTSIRQRGNASVEFVAGSVPENTLSIENPSKFSFAGFSTSENAATLAFGNNSPSTQKIYEILNGNALLPDLEYRSNYYGYTGTIYHDHSGAPVFNGIEAAGNNARYDIVTADDSTKETALRLISDTSGHLHDGTKVRGWSIRKTGTDADLAFTFTDNDPEPATTNRGPYDVMRLNGHTNQIEFPVATTGTYLPANLTAQLLWGNDTNLHRADANTLQTDGNFIVGTNPTTKLTVNSLTPNRAVVSNASSQLESSVTTTIELGYLSGITSPVQAQLTGKVDRAGDTMTGALQLPAGTTALPSLNFTSGGVNAGIYSPGTNQISLSTAATERLNIAATGALTAYAPLNLATQSALNFQDLTGGEFVGLRAPATVGTSYTVDLPGAAPTTGQVLQATSPSATTWGNVGGSPVIAKTYYVTKNGSDSTGNGSLSAPFASVYQAVATASLDLPNPYTNPIAINVGAGIFPENKILIAVGGLSIIGSSLASTSLFPLDAAQPLFDIKNADFTLANLSLQANPIPSPHSSSAGIAIDADDFGLARFNTISVTNFATGMDLTSTTGVPGIFINNSLFVGNSLGINNNNSQLIFQNSIIQGPVVAMDTPINTGIITNGIHGVNALTNSLFRLLNITLQMDNESFQKVLSCNIENSNNALICNSSSKSQVIGVNFSVNNPSSVNVAVNDATIHIEGCLFDCESRTNEQAGTAIMATNNGSVIANACTIEKAEIGIICGTTGASGDTSSVDFTGFTIRETATCLYQRGLGTIHYVGSSLDVTKVKTETPANLTISGFNSHDQSTLALGNTSNAPQKIYQIVNDE